MTVDYDSIWSLIQRRILGGDITDAELDAALERIVTDPAPPVTMMSTFEKDRWVDEINVRDLARYLWVDEERCADALARIRPRVERKGA